MSDLSFLLEIGAEEIPDWMIQPALKHLRDLFEAVIADYSLGGTVAWVDGTPRRLTLRADGIIARQADTEETVMGPPKSAAYKDGKPTGALTGFAKKMGIGVDELRIEATPKGEYLAYTKKVAGRPALEILAAELPGVITKIYFPKAMYWTGKGGIRFIRPIRWIVALLGDQVVPFELAGVKSGNTTNGHRRLGVANVPVTVDNYEQELSSNFVLLRAADRRAKIEAEIHTVLAGTGLVHREDASLLETLTYLTEFPTPILGGFDPSYLELPAEVLVTVMRHHQRYFSLETPDGRLAPFFVTVMNTSADPDGLVRQGNERVLRARFNDGRFFWDFDQQKKLADRVDDLKNVTFQAKLGSYYDKSQRVVALIKELGGGEDAQRAALLAKCDLTCEMVKEFTELQGIVGGLYARHQGETEEVALAIYDQYKPESMEDALPGTVNGQLLSLADKLDTLRGCFAIGLMPSGSKDPFALRRAAQGIVRILAEGQLNIPVPTDGELGTFFRDRIEYYFREVRKFPYDEVRATMGAGFADIKDLAARLEALHAVRPTENFEPLAAGFKRIQNILRQAQFAQGGQVDEALLEAGPERDLWEAFALVTAANKVESSNYRLALEAIANLRPAVDTFFDKVLVNSPDARVRQNRLNLLSSLLTESSAIADFSEIVTS
ncbi:MAG: glycine--tRNA ligase subunit beta [Bryobacteraceae bacterium]